MLVERITEESAEGRVTVLVAAWEPLSSVLDLLPWLDRDEVADHAHALLGGLLQLLQPEPSHAQAHGAAAADADGDWAMVPGEPVADDSLAQDLDLLLCSPVCSPGVPGADGPQMFDGLLDARAHVVPVVEAGPVPGLIGACEDDFLDLFIWRDLHAPLPDAGETSDDQSFARKP